jgi:ABC-2 type transport system ATP-binding protein
MVNDPDLIFLDEPTTGLDRRLEGRSGGHTQAQVPEQDGDPDTHYMEEAEVLSDRVAIMNDGSS